MKRYLTRRAAVKRSIEIMLQAEREREELVRQEAEQYEDADQTHEPPAPIWQPATRSGQPRGYA